MIRKDIKIECTENDKIEIAHLSSISRTVVWVSRPLGEIEIGSIVLVQGVIRSDGYLSLKILKNDKMVYPRKTFRSEAFQPGVTIALTGLNLNLLYETFECSDCEKQKIIDHRRHYQARVEWRT